MAMYTWQTLDALQANTQIKYAAHDRIFCLYENSYYTMSNKSDPDDPYTYDWIKIEEGTVINPFADVPSADETGNTVTFEVNEENYVVTVSLLNKKGVIISTNNIDLPIEEMFTDAAISGNNLVLTRKSGTTKVIDITNLINETITVDDTFKNQIEGIFSAS